MKRATGRVVVLGSEGRAGSYLLRIRLSADLQLAFGRFLEGQPLPLPAGDYVYLGSARAQRGGPSLAQRLLRHATRSGQAPPHRIRPRLARALAAAGLVPATTRAPAPKTVFWHVDHLLDRREAEIDEVFVLRSPRPLEERLAALLERDPRTRVVERGLGASDSPGATHLLRIAACEAWWRALPGSLAALLAEDRSGGGHDVNC